MKDDLKKDETRTDESETPKKRDRETIVQSGYYELSEVAELLAMSEYTVISYLRDGRMKGVKAGGRWIISFKNYQRFIDGEVY